MNYSKQGVQAKQKTLNSKSAKWGRKLVFTSIKLFLIAIIGVSILGVSTGIGMFRGILASTPSISLDSIVPDGEASIIFDNQGNEIDKVVSSNSNRINMKDMALIPKNLGHAFIALEDERFYLNNGIDIKGLFRAGFQYIKSGFKRTQGASTITQQLLKNAVFTDWTSEGDNNIKKIKRKIQEQYLAIEASKYFPKEKILLEYMNTINLGQNTLGVEAASQRYFGKSCSELNLSECAVIASITQNPSKYNPISHPEQNVKRRKTCLNKMLELEFITQAEYDEAMADTDKVYDRISLHNIDYQESVSARGTYFSDAVQKQIKKDLVEQGVYNESVASNMLYSGGLRIYTTLDPDIQRIMDEEFSNAENYPEDVKWGLDYALTVTHNGKATNYSKENMRTYFRENINKNFELLFSSQDEALEAIETYKASIVQEGDDVDENYTMTIQPQASMTVIDQNTGYVLGIIGGRGTKEGRLTLNRATDTTRQPGSTFKVLASYAPALDSAGLTLASVYNDAPFNYNDGKPVNNYDKKYEGIVSIRYAIKKSKNIVAVKTLTQITPQLGYDYLLNFGFSTLTEGKTIGNEWKTDIVQSLCLGGITRGVTNMELTAAYASIANGGAYNEPKLYTLVTDSSGNILLDNRTPQSHQVIKPTTAYLLTDAMVDVVNGGTGSSVKFDNMAIAGKTGTTSDNRDVWFAGFTPYYTAATWVGYDNNTKMNSTETRLARGLWKAVMSRIHAELPNEQFSVPDGIVSQAVCSESGLLPIPGLCNTVSESFAEGTVPTTSCNIHYQGNVCGYDLKPATEECPFKQPGVLTLPLIEDASLSKGSGGAQTSGHCQHDASFFANPDYEIIINQQSMEKGLRTQQPPAEGNENNDPPDDNDNNNNDNNDNNNDNNNNGDNNDGNANPNGGAADTNPNSDGNGTDTNPNGSNNGADTNPNNNNGNTNPNNNGDNNNGGTTQP